MIRIMKESWSFLLSEDMKKIFLGPVQPLKVLEKNCGINLFYRIRFKRTPLKGKSRGGWGEGGGAWRQVWVELCCRGLQFKLTSWNLIVGTAHVDRSSPTFTLFPSDTMLKALNCEIYWSRLELVSQISTTWSVGHTRLGQNKPCKWG